MVRWWAAGTGYCLCGELVGRRVRMLSVWWDGVPQAHLKFTAILKGYPASKVITEDLNDQSAVSNIVTVASIVLAF